MLDQMTNQDVVEYMAFDRSNDPEFVEMINRQRELEESDNMTAEQQSKAIMAILGGTNR